MKEHSTPTSALLNWGLVSKYRNQLFGFAIIWIMLMHSKIASRLWCNAAGFSLCILVPILLEVLQSDFLNRFLNFFGTISLELYLSHVALKNVVKKLCPDFPDWSAKKSVIVYFCILVTALVFSYLFHLVQTKVELACTKKRKESF